MRLDMSACRPRMEYDGAAVVTFFWSYAPGPGVPLPPEPPPWLRFAVPKPHFGEPAITALLDPANAPLETGGGLYAPGPGLLLFKASLFVRARIEYFGASPPILDVLV